jgi:hypothetical protein
MRAERNFASKLRCAPTWPLPLPAAPACRGPATYTLMDFGTADCQDHECVDHSSVRRTSFEFETYDGRCMQATRGLRSAVMRRPSGATLRGPTCHSSTNTATDQVPSDVHWHDTFLEGCGGDHRAAESLLRKTLLAPSVAEAVNAVHQHVASNPSDDHFDAAKEGLSRVFCDFFERANQAEAMQMASLHMLALHTLRRKLRREVDGVMGRPAIIRNKAGSSCSSTSAPRSSNRFRKTF